MSSRNFIQYVDCDFIDMASEMSCICEFPAFLVHIGF